MHGELGRTMVYVTHDQVEALTLGDRIAVLERGRVAQVGRLTTSIAVLSTASLPPSSVAPR